MKILELNWVLEPGGQDRHVIDLSNHLTSHGHYVLVGSQGGRWVEQLHCPHVTLPFAACFPLPGRKPLSPRELLRLGRVLRGLRRILVNRQIEIVHCHGVPGVVFTGWLRQRRSLVVHTHHGCREADWEVHSRRVVGRCDWYIGASRHTAVRLVEIGCPPDRVSSIHYGITYQQPSDKDWQEAAQIRHAVGVRSGREDDVKLVVTVARLHYQKGLDVLVRAVRHVARTMPEARFVIVGGGPERDAIAKSISQLGLREHVFLVGHQENVLPYLLAGDLFCLPSRWEALPLAIPEAYRAGLPVVATAVGGVPEIVHEGVTGWLVEPERPSALATTLVRRLSHSERLKECSRRAQAYGYARRFDPLLVHAQVEQLYERLLAERSERGRSIRCV